MEEILVWNERKLPVSKIEKSSSVSLEKSSSVILEKSS